MVEVHNQIKTQEKKEDKAKLKEAGKIKHRKVYRTEDKEHRGLEG